jgi:hypothetical protein
MSCHMRLHDHVGAQPVQSYLITWTAHGFEMAPATDDKKIENEFTCHWCHQRWIVDCFLWCRQKTRYRRLSIVSDRIDVHQTSTFALIIHDIRLADTTEEKCSSNIEVTHVKTNWPYLSFSRHKYNCMMSSIVLRKKQEEREERIRQAVCRRFALARHVDTSRYLNSLCRQDVDVENCNRKCRDNCNLLTSNRHVSETNDRTNPIRINNKSTRNQQYICSVTFLSRSQSDRIEIVRMFAITNVISFDGWQPANKSMLIDKGYQQQRT